MSHKLNSSLCLWTKLLIMHLGYPSQVHQIQDNATTPTMPASKASGPRKDDAPLLEVVVFAATCVACCCATPVLRHLISSFPFASLSLLQIWLTRLPKKYSTKRHHCYFHLSSSPSTCRTRPFLLLLLNSRLSYHLIRYLWLLRTSRGRGVRWVEKDACLVIRWCVRKMCLRCNDGFRYDMSSTRYYATNPDDIYSLPPFALPFKKWQRPGTKSSQHAAWHISAHHVSRS